MANRVYFIPRRNDLDGMNIQVTDLYPNTSQRNGELDGEGQTHYLGACPDTPGTTIVSGTSYVSGSRSTTLLANPVIDDTTGGGNDCYAVATTTLGLAAYLRERVQKATNTSFLTFANANNIAVAIRAVVEAGTPLTVAAINALIAAEDAGSSLTAGTSFGSLEDILRILSGEVYISPQYTIITTQVPVFIGLAARQALVAAQDTSGNGGVTFVAQGHFLTASEHGYAGRPTLARTGTLLASLGAGQLSHRNTAVPLFNPAFTYGAAGTAMAADGVTHIPATGIYAALRVVDDAGNIL